MVNRDQEHVDKLARVAYELRSRVRNDVPVANGLWLYERLPRIHHDLWGLVFVQSCAIPANRSWRELTAWVFDHQAPIPDDPLVVAERRLVLLDALAPKRRRPQPVDNPVGEVAG